MGLRLTIPSRRRREGGREGAGRFVDEGEEVGEAAEGGAPGGMGDASRVVEDLGALPRVARAEVEARRRRHGGLGISGEDEVRDVVRRLGHTRAL